MPPRKTDLTTLKDDAGVDLDVATDVEALKTKINATILGVRDATRKSVQTVLGVNAANAADAASGIMIGTHAVDDIKKFAKGLKDSAKRPALAAHAHELREKFTNVFLTHPEIDVTGRDKLDIKTSIQEIDANLHAAEQAANPTNPTRPGTGAGRAEGLGTEKHKTKMEKWVKDPLKKLVPGGLAVGGLWGATALAPSIVYATMKAGAAGAWEYMSSVPYIGKALETTVAGVNAVSAAAGVNTLATLGVILPGTLWTLGHIKREFLRAKGKEVKELKGWENLTTPIANGAGLLWDTALLPLRLGIKTVGWTTGKATKEIAETFTERKLATVLGGVAGFVVMPALTGGASLPWTIVGALAGNIIKKKTMAAGSAPAAAGGHAAPAPPGL